MNVVENIFFLHVNNSKAKWILYMSFLLEQGFPNFLGHDCLNKCAGDPHPPTLAPPFVRYENVLQTAYIKHYPNVKTE